MELGLRWLQPQQSCHQKYLQLLYQLTLRDHTYTSFARRKSALRFSLFFAFGCSMSMSIDLLHLVLLPSHLY